MPEPTEYVCTGCTALYDSQQAAVFCAQADDADQG